MTSAPAVSIIVNNYNYGRFLADAIDSALAQTYERTEIIVVDDGSTDASRDIISSFGCQVIPVLKDNEGQGSAFNAGFARSSGDIVIFLDADDLLLPEAVETAVPLFQEPNTVKVHWNLWEIDGRGRRLGGLHKKSLIAGDLSEEFIQKGPLSLPQSPTSGNAWARWFLQKVMPLPEHEDRHGADGFLKKLCPIFGTIRRLDQPMGCYRIHENSYGGGRDLLFKLRRSLSRYPAYCTALAHHLKQMGIFVSPEAWTGTGSQYAWLADAVALHDDVRRVVPAGHRVLLIDDNALGQEFFTGYQVVPFLEDDGRYWGQPADDAHGIRELERLRSQGSEFLLVAFPAFWWRQFYRGFFSYVEATYRLVGQNERLMTFDLRAGSDSTTENAQAATADATPGPGSKR